MSLTDLKAMCVYVPFQEWSVEQVKQFFLVCHGGRYASEYEHFNGLNGAELMYLTQEQVWKRSPARGDILFSIFRQLSEFSRSGFPAQELSTDLNNFQDHKNLQHSFHNHNASNNNNGNGNSNNNVNSNSMNNGHSLDQLQSNQLDDTWPSLLSNSYKPPQQQQQLQKLQQQHLQQQQQPLTDSHFQPTTSSFSLFPPRSMTHTRAPSDSSLRYFQSLSQPATQHPNLPSPISASPGPIAQGSTFFPSHIPSPLTRGSSGSLPSPAAPIAPRPSCFGFDSFISPLAPPASFPRSVSGPTTGELFSATSCLNSTGLGGLPLPNSSSNNNSNNSNNNSIDRNGALFHHNLNNNSISNDSLHTSPPSSVISRTAPKRSFPVTLTSSHNDTWQSLPSLQPLPSFSVSPTAPLLSGSDAAVQPVLSTPLNGGSFNAFGIGGVLSNYKASLSSSTAAISPVHSLQPVGQQHPQAPQHQQSPQEPSAPLLPFPSPSVLNHLPQHQPFSLFPSTYQTRGALLPTPDPPQILSHLAGHGLSYVDSQAGGLRNGSSSPVSATSFSLPSPSLARPRSTSKSAPSPLPVPSSGGCDSSISGGSASSLASPLSPQSRQSEEDEEHASKLSAEVSHLELNSSELLANGGGGSSGDLTGPSYASALKRAQPASINDMHSLSLSSSSSSSSSSVSAFPSTPIVPPPVVTSVAGIPVLPLPVKKPSPTSPSLTSSISSFNRKLSSSSSSSSTPIIINKLKKRIDTTNPPLFVVVPPSWRSESKTKCWTKVKKVLEKFGKIASKKWSGSEKEFCEVQFIEWTDKKMRDLVVRDEGRGEDMNLRVYMEDKTYLPFKMCTAPFPQN